MIFKSCNGCLRDAEVAVRIRFIYVGGNCQIHEFTENKLVSRFGILITEAYRSGMFLGQAKLKKLQLLGFNKNKIKFLSALPSLT